MLICEFVDVKIIVCYKTNGRIVLSAVKENFLCCNFVNSPSQTTAAKRFRVCALREILTLPIVLAVNLNTVCFAIKAQL